MSRRIPVCALVFAAICASTVLASAQISSSPTESGTTHGSASAVAYVYVSNVPSGDTARINAYAAAADGSLTKVPGSPFADNVTYMAVNGKWLFALENTIDASVIDSYSIASNGALTLKDTLTAEPDPGFLSVYLDHTGSTLYADYYTTNNDYMQYSINQSTGQLSFIGDLAGGPSDNSVVSFVGNNLYAYSSSCYHYTPLIASVQRASDGTLSRLSTNPPFPPAPSGDFWCPWLAAADPTNHLAVAMAPVTGDWASDGPYQLAAYTVDSSGNLSTTSTYSNMPKVSVGGVTGYCMSPDGKYLAVGGGSGFQIFHFKGANPITKFTGLLTNNPIDQVFWDNANHVYAISRSKGKLFVWTVKSTGVTKAPGSPHAITGPVNLIVLPKS